MSASVELDAASYVVEPGMLSAEAEATIPLTTTLRIDRVVTVSPAQERLVDAEPALTVVFPHRTFASATLAAQAMVEGSTFALSLRAQAQIGG